MRKPDLTPRQRRVIERSRELLNNPGAVVPPTYAAGDNLGRVSYILGALTAQMRFLLEVTEELAGMGEDGEDEDEDDPALALSVVFADGRYCGAQHEQDGTVYYCDRFLDETGRHDENHTAPGWDENHEVTWPQIAPAGAA